jgi:glycosyltransferase involved in cell wall biosynthesis
MPTSPTHILYIAEFSTGGSVESLLCLVGGLDRSEFKATVLFYSMPDEATSERFSAAGAAVCSLYPFRSEKGGRKQLPRYSLQAKIRTIFGRRIQQLYASFKYVLYFLRFRLSVYRDIRQQIGLLQPDVIHLNNGVGSDTPGILAARSCKIPVVCHSRTFARLAPVNVAAAGAVRRFVCISNAVRDHLVATGVAHDRCVVIPNAVDLQHFSQAEKEPAGIREEFGWDDSHQLFVLVGRVVSWKGQDIFIQAIAEAQQSDPSIRGLIVGDSDPSDVNDEYIDKLRTLITESELDDTVKFAGHRTDIPNIMQTANVVVCASSLPEPFGRVIIESMAVGTIAIATNAGGAVDIIEDGVNGLLIPINESAAMANAMLRLSRDQALAHTLRTEALSTVAKNFTIERHVNQISDIYRSLVNA